MKKKFVLMLALAALAIPFVACHWSGWNNETSPTEPNDKARVYVQAWAYYVGGPAVGIGVKDITIVFRDDSIPKYESELTGPDGYTERIEWPKVPGPMNLDARGPALAGLVPYHAEGVEPNCKPDEVHHEDTICIYKIPMSTV